MQRRLREAGRIRLGEQLPTKDRNGNDTTRPGKLEKFRFTSADKAALLQIADLCGGTVQPWEGAPVGEQFELYADCKTLDVLVPPVELAFSQWYELWNGGGCKRRCDGQTNVITDKTCECDPDNMECKPTTRLGVILTAIDGIGIWRLETHGWNAAQELNGAIEVLRVIQSKGAMVPARLMLEQRQSKRDGKTYNYAVPVLDLNLSVAALTGASARPQLESGVTPIAKDQAPPVLSISDQVRAAETPVERPRRSNAAPTIPSTGLAPRPAAAVNSQPADDPASIRPPAIPTTGSSTGPLLTEPQGKMIGRLFTKLKIKDRQERLDFLSDKFKHPFDSSKELTKQEASTLIEELMTLAGEESKPFAPRQRTEEPAAEDETDYDAYPDAAPF
jgi:hypothetical protein